MEADFYRYEMLRPDQLEQVVRKTPIAYWPLGLLEHHGWHLPIGFDGIKAERLCGQCAGITGGVLLPVMWWGGGGGHGGFKWTHYQDETAAGEMVFRTVERLVQYGFRAIVLLCGHYPWEGILRSARIEEAIGERSDVTVIYGTEVSIAQDVTQVPDGDHAAKQETNYGLYLLPELVSRESLTAGRDESVWPPEGIPAETAQFPHLEINTASPRFAQLGDDPAESSFQQGESQTLSIVAAIAGLVETALGGKPDHASKNKGDS